VAIEELRQLQTVIGAWISLSFKSGMAAGVTCALVPPSFPIHLDFRASISYLWFVVDPYFRINGARCPHPETQGDYRAFVVKRCYEVTSHTTA